MTLTDVYAEDISTDEKIRALKVVSEDIKYWVKSLKRIFHVSEPTFGC